MNFLKQTQTPTSGIQHEETDITAFVEKNDCGKGKLIIAEDLVYWIKPDGQGMTIPYPAISLHAVSRDVSTFPHECLYLMIDSDLAELGDGGEAMDDDEGSEGSEGKISEIRFVPNDSAILQTLFDNMSNCQILHPDPEEEDMSEEEEEDEGVEDDFEDASVEVGGGDATSGMSDLKITDQSNGHGNHNGSMPNGESNLVSNAVEAGQFDDADMGPDQ